MRSRAQASLPISYSLTEMFLPAGAGVLTSSRQAVTAR
jgi:hypothetical protein